MRHRRKGRALGRNPNHQRALLRNLASALFLTERDEDEYFDVAEAPKVKGRIVTTLPKAKEVRPLVEKCVTIARKALAHEEAAAALATDAEHGSSEWRAWRQGPQWQEWNKAIAPAVAARRRVLQLIGDKEAVRTLFDRVAHRFVDRNGGYTRILRLAHPRLGDAGTRAILEFVGVRDRVKAEVTRPSFDVEDDDATAEAAETAEATSESNVAEDAASSDAAASEEQTTVDEKTEDAPAGDSAETSTGDDDTPPESETKKD